MSKEHLNYLRRKTADEAEIWAADRIEELEREVERLNKIKSRTRQAELQAENDAMQADNAHLRKVLKLIKYETDIRGNLLNKFIKQEAIEALAATPEQSLGRYRNAVLEEAAKELDRLDYWYSARAIRAMKEPK